MVEQGKDLNYNEEMKLLEKPLVPGAVWFLLRPVGKLLVQLPYGLKAVDREPLEALKPPYLVLPIHSTFLDSGFLGLHSRWPIRYVAADGNFRTRLQGLVFRLLGAVPKAKGVSEIDLIKGLIRIKLNGGIIGIFPEGQQVWDGTTLPLIFATAKLVKLFKVPAVVPVIRGGYLCRPRWSFRRRGRGVEISYREVFSAEKIKSLSVEELFAEMTRILSWDDHRWQEETGRIVFRRKFRAEGIERLLFVCPVCRSVGTLRSENNRFACTSCRLEVEVNRRGTFDSPGLPEEIRQERDWNRWQNRWLAEHLDSLAPEAEVFRDDPAELYRGYKTRKMEKLGTGALVLYRNGRLVFQGGEGHEFSLEAVSAVNVFKQDIFEFYSGGELYRIIFPTRRVSAYKWYQTIHRLKSSSPETVE